MIQNPVWTLFRAAIHGLLGRLRFPEKLSGRVLITGKSEKFTVFRQVEVKIGSKYLVKPGAVFRIRFRFTGGPPGLNQKLSLIPIPLIVGFPGFRTKIRTIQEETGTFEGIYEWDSAEAAADYSESLAIRLMKMRAVP